MDSCHKHRISSILTKEIARGQIRGTGLPLQIACVPPWSEDALGEFLHNRHLVRMEMQVIVKYSSHWTIGKPKGRSMSARRTSWGSQDWSSHCLNVLRWSDGPRYSSSSSCQTPGLPERIDPSNNWFPVWNRASRGYIETISKGALGCNHRPSIRKVGFDGKRTFLTTPTHDCNWKERKENFNTLSLEWNHAHPATTSTAWLPCKIKKEVMLPHPVYNYND